MANLEKTVLEKALDKIKKIVSDAGGKVSETKEWGKRELAYPIRRPGLSAGGQKEGLYYLFSLDLEGKEAKPIDEKIKREEGVLRHLLVKTS